MFIFYFLSQMTQHPMFRQFRHIHYWRTPLEIYKANKVQVDEANWGKVDPLIELITPLHHKITPWMVLNMADQWDANSGRGFEGGAFLRQLNSGSALSPWWVESLVLTSDARKCASTRTLDLWSQEVSVLHELDQRNHCHQYPKSGNAPSLLDLWSPFEQNIWRQEASLYFLTRSMERFLLTTYVRKCLLS